MRPSLGACQLVVEPLLTVNLHLGKLRTASKGYGLRSACNDLCYLCEFMMGYRVGEMGMEMAHNHPSMDPSRSVADIRVTRDLVRAGQLLKIDILDTSSLARRSCRSAPWANSTCSPNANPQPGPSCAFPWGGPYWSSSQFHFGAPRALWETIKISLPFRGASNVYCSSLDG